MGDFRKMLVRLAAENAEYVGPLFLYYWREENAMASHRFVSIEPAESWGDHRDSANYWHEMYLLCRSINASRGVNSLAYKTVSTANWINYFWTNSLKLQRCNTTRQQDKIASADSYYYYDTNAKQGIARPDALVFFTGVGDDTNLRACIPDVEFKPCGDFSPQALVKLRSDFLPERAFRTHTLNFWRYSGNEAILNFLACEVLV
ncbi:MAG: hypothetical protein JSR44_16620 [Spirochaetes bacterium]|nr:hypothetical protein [Spirochaetota bacterium]